MRRKTTTSYSGRLFADQQRDLFEKSYEEMLQEEGNKTVECLGLTFPNDEERRKYFLEKLREKFKDPEFLKIEGFPIGSDQDILALSDPPYYTACPNPFVGDFIKRYSKTYDPNEVYSREPFATDVSEGKNDPIYNAHSYHTKVPHKAIMRYILHYTEPGDVIFDGFCGTGMTGVASQLCGDKGAVESLGYHVLSNGEVTDDKGRTLSALGRRQAVICDLSTEATFIAHSLNSPYSEREFASTVKEISIKTLETNRELYLKELQGSGQKKALSEIVYTVWSDVVRCPECFKEFLYSEAAVSVDWTNERSPFVCPGCNAELTTRKLERVMETKWDHVLGRSIKISKQLPVLISTNSSGLRTKTAPNPDDLSKALLISPVVQPSGPVEILLQLERYFKDSLHLRNFTHVHHLYTERTWKVLSDIWKEIQDAKMIGQRTRQQLVALFTSLLPRLDKLNRYMPDHQRHVGPLVGTLYVSWLTVEISPLVYLRDKSKTFLGLHAMPGHVIISTASSTECHCLPANSIDYIFTDPPFGQNLQYAELNQRAEAWLRVKTNTKPEAIVSASQRKGLDDYQRLMTKCFIEAYRILKHGRWITVEFHNSRNSVWNAIQESMAVAGFVVADVRTLDKKKGTTNQLFYSSGAVKQDLVITAYKPNGGFEDRFKLEAGTEDGVWDFIRTHLRQLPIFVSKDDHAEIIAERQSYLLFDRMVAFHVQRGVTIPMSAADFYAGLARRFSERDGMYFLPEQVAEYDKKRMTIREILQLQLFITDENSAIQWLKQQLTIKPQTFQEIHPQFLKEIGGWQKHEKPLELSELLEQSFIRYDGKSEVPSQIHSYLSTNFKELRNLPKDDDSLRGKAKDRWYVPDPNKAGDLEKLRERSLLKEFEEYRTSSQKRLKVFRLEAVRTGFKKAWQDHDYPTIIAVASKIPENILQEDPKLLMWYDQAVTRTGEDN